MSFQAVVIRKDDQGYRAAIEAVDESDLRPYRTMREISGSRVTTGRAGGIWAPGCATLF